MDAEKLIFTSPSNLHQSYTRATNLAKQHRPLVAFFCFAFFLLIIRQLPWGLSSSYTSSSLDRWDPAYNRTMGPGSGTYSWHPSTNRTGKAPRFAKVTLASGFEDVLYERAIDTHLRHAEKHGYSFHMARENAADGMFNKIAYIMNVLMSELYKPADERCEWIFYFDADTIIMNQEIPLEIFEPPSDFQHINWIAGKDWNGLNAGVFLLRVNKWSLNLLSRVMTYQHYHPDEDYTFEEQSILARLVENGEEFKKESIYVPREWFNAYFYFLSEVKPGLLISHFPHYDYKWHMYEWLQVLENDQDPAFKPVYNLPLLETTYPSAIKDFWNAKRRVDKVLKGFERNVNRGADPILFGMQHDETKELADQFREKFEELKKASRDKTDEPKELDKLTNEAEELNAKLIQALMAYFETHDNPPAEAGF